jgi:response regulator RpfG family c-di-GMP phosphodiesterase
MHVAVIDDQESSLQGFSQILRRIAAAEAACFKRGADALHWIAGVEPAFIVINSTLADMEGVAFLHRMRALPGRANVPVIFTTGKPTREMRREAFELHVRAFLEKPINPTEFLVHAMHIVDAFHEREDMKKRLTQVGSSSPTPAAATNGKAHGAAATIDAMLSVAALHDPSIIAHHDLSSKIAIVLARELKLTQKECDTLALASRIYDIGKAEIPQRILESRNTATGPDRVNVERHIEIGAKLLAEHDDEVMRTAALIAQTHHERYDGSGYPKKLRRSEIPIMGRIVAVSDTMSALLRPRGDREALSLAQTIEVLERSSGTLFDPAVVTAVRGNLADISRIVHECSSAG